MIINFGLIGCGNIGERHARLIQQNPYAKLIGCYDVIDSRSTVLSQQTKVKKFISLSSLLDDKEINIVSICTPNFTHSLISIESLRAGKHVLVEKPMALRKQDCENMLSMALSLNKQLFVVKQNRYNPPVSALKEKLTEGKLGKIFFVNVNCYWNRSADYYSNSDWKGSLVKDGGTLFTQFSHFIDIMFYLFGDVINISGIIDNAGHKDLIEFEDTGSFNFAFKSGGLGSFNFTTNAFQKNMEGSITVFAEKGTIKIGGQYLNIIDYQSIMDEFPIENLPPSNPPNNYGYYQGSMSNHDKVINNVVETLMGRGKMDVTAMDGMKTVEIIEEMYSVAKRLF